MNTAVRTKISGPDELTKVSGHRTPTTQHGDAEIARPDFARLDNAKPSSTGGHRET